MSFLEEYYSENLADDEKSICLMSNDDREQDYCHMNVVRFDDSMNSCNNDVPEQKSFENIDHFPSQSFTMDGPKSRR